MARCWNAIAGAEIEALSFLLTAAGSGEKICPCLYILEFPLAISHKRKNKRVNYLDVSSDLNRNVFFYLTNLNCCTLPFACLKAAPWPTFSMRTCVGSQCETNNACHTVHWGEDDRPPPSSSSHPDTASPRCLPRAEQRRRASMNPLTPDATCFTRCSAAGSAHTFKSHINWPDDSFFSARGTSALWIICWIWCNINFAAHSFVVQFFGGVFCSPLRFKGPGLFSRLSCWLAECFWMTAVRLKCVLRRFSWLCVKRLLNIHHRPDEK